MAGVDASQLSILKESKNVLLGKSLSLESHFGKGLSERCIETPWVASHLRDCQQILDIGFTFASLEYLGLLLELKENHHLKIDAIDIIEPKRVASRYPQEWFDSIMEVNVSIGDIRTINLPADKYDAVTLISTIEHVGFDEPSKTLERSAFERKKTKEDVNMIRDASTDSLVLTNLHHALKKGGKLLVSVPMGAGGSVLLQDSLGYYCAQWEYEQKTWNALVGHSGFELIEQRFFGLDDEGWTEVSSPSELRRQSSHLKLHASGCALAALKKK
jgi:SAM-dependent methyltransferase